MYQFHLFIFTSEQFQPSVCDTVAEKVLLASSRGVLQLLTAHMLAANIAVFVWLRFDERKV